MSKNSNIGQAILLPSNILAEEIIIGQLLSDNSTRQYILINTTNNFFSLYKHRILYSCSAKAQTKHNLTETIHTLWNKKLLQAAGGLTGIISIVHKSSAVSLHDNKYACINHFIKILHCNYVKRLFMQYSYSVLQLSHFYRLSIREIYNKASKYLSDVHKNTETQSTISLRENIGSILYALRKSGNKDTKILSGFRELDIITSGFTAGELVVIAGRPSMGKTSLAINVAHYVIFKLKLQVEIFSLEMSKNEILDKLISLATSISVQKIQQKAIKENDWSKIQKACSLLTSSLLCIDDYGSASIEYIKQQCKNRLIKKKALSSLITFS